MDEHEERRCRLCGKVKPLTEFAVYRGRAADRDTRCKACVAARISNWRSRKARAAAGGAS